MSTIYLIRHGQASFGQANYDQLSALGEQQAEHLGVHLAQRLTKPDGAILGSLKRHQQTAERVLAGFDSDLEALNAQYLSGWNEYDHQELLACLRPEFETAESMMNYMRKQNNPSAAIEASFDDAMTRWMSGSHDEQYSETWLQFKQRVHAALETTIVSAREKQNIFVFTSGGPISLVAQHLLGVPSEQLMRLNWTLLNCGVTKLVVTPSRTFLSCLNEHSHFESAQTKHFLTYS